jgi:murein DD-endopeptidase MepM/ murein hydrolase activator NlpD
VILTQIAIVLVGAIVVAQAGVPFQADQDIVTHGVYFGETLSGLAQLAGVDEAQLAQMNRLTRGDTLRVGEQIELPQPPQPAYLLYRVSQGETLLKIAARYAVSPYGLQQLNHLACTGCLVAGQQLRIPVPISTTLAASDALPYPLVAVRLSSTTPQQGDVLVVRVQTDQASQVQGQLGIQPIHFVPDDKSGAGGYIGLLGLDAMLAPDAYRLTITATAENGAVGSASGLIHERPGSFVLESVTIAQRLMPLLDPDLNDNEEREIKSIYSAFSPEKWWDGPFNLPVAGKLISGYGNRRVYNGINLGTYHSGYDISASIGTPVKAGAPGRVIAVKQFAIRGLIVVIDHGQGVLTGYFHLSQANVKEGQFVDQGEVIGAVGTSGRSQGPHVHFDLAVGGVTVDPGYWTKVALP